MIQDPVKHVGKSAVPSGGGGCTAGWRPLRDRVMDHIHNVQRI